jgi:hypothetical protein
MRKAAQSILMVAEMNDGWLKLAQETQSREQIIGHAFRAVRIIGIPSCSCPECGHIGEVAKMKDGLRFVSRAEFQHCPGSPWIG